MSLLIRAGRTSCKTKTSVESTRRGRRNPVLIRGSGLPVMKNLTLGICPTKRPNMERIADDGSSSLHSSRTSITMTVEMPVDLSGSTINFTIWPRGDSWVTSGSDWRRVMRTDLNFGYLRASWKARVGKMKWRLLRSLKSREQKKDAPSSPSAKAHSLIVWAIVDLPVPASPFNQKTGDLSKSFVHNSIALRTVSRVPRRQPLRSPCWYPAPGARGQLFSTNKSAVRRAGELTPSMSAMGLTCVLGEKSLSEMTHITFIVTHNQPALVVVHRPLLSRLSKDSTLVTTAV